MKIIHAADLHLGSKMEAKLPPDKARIRRNELRAAFQKMIAFAEENGVSVILLSGDVFDSDAPLRKDKEFFYSAVREHPDIDFLYLRGNHDVLTSYVESDLPNLRLFGENWTSYSYGNVCVSGIEISAANATSLYSSFRPDPGRLNIVMLHGQTGDAVGEGRVHVGKLADAGIDYLALGHVHAYRREKLGRDGIRCYPGCLEGRGFDEPGEHGFVLLDVSDRITDTFIPNSVRQIREISVDISDAGDAYQAFSAVSEKMPKDSGDLIRVLLTGSPDFDTSGLDRYVGNLLTGHFFVSVKDKTVRRFEREVPEGRLSLQSEFIRAVNASDRLSGEQKQRVIQFGLRALEGRDPED